MMAAWIGAALRRQKRLPKMEKVLLKRKLTKAQEQKIRDDYNSMLEEMGETPSTEDG